ncbi:MAG: hypothetical protein ACFFEN_10525 [Candidatus Thorarchaeota archaeon]
MWWVLAGIVDFTYHLNGYTNGIYYFVVAGVNSNGYTLSNCVEVVVQIMGTGYPPTTAIITITSVAGVIGVIGVSIYLLRRKKRVGKIK